MLTSVLTKKEILKLILICAIRKVFRSTKTFTGPHVPDAWVNEGICDMKDGDVGKVGYEINFNRYFYRYQPPRPLEEI